MSLRAKLALVLAALAGLAAVGVGWLSYDATSTRMLSEIDATLRNTDRYSRPGGGGPAPFPIGDEGFGRPFGSGQEVLQVFDADGARLRSTDDIEFPISDGDIGIATSGEGRTLRTVTGSDGHSYRIVTFAANVTGQQVGVQLGRDLSEMERVLSDLRARILLIGGIAIALAAIAGWLAAKRLTRSLRELTTAAGQVSSTGRLDIDVPESGGKDEVGQLGKAFSSMLGALSRSRNEQQRLVQDAGHELRTPLTSLRTNVDVLRRHGDMPAEMRRKILSDLDTEVGELSALVEEVVAVGSGRTSDEPARPLHLADAVNAAVERVGRRTGRTITVDADQAVVVAQRALLERAITNLLDNAAKFDGSDEPIEVTARKGTVSVRDHGPGIAPDDLAHVFDRFFRSVASRSQPGSGLGLSIVTEVAAAHRGTTFADNHPGGGAIVGFTLPIDGS